MRILRVGLCALCLLGSAAQSAEIEPAVLAEMSQYGPARLIIVVDPHAMVPQAVDDEDGLRQVAEKLSEDGRHGLHQIGRLPVLAGELAAQELDKIKDIAGVTVTLSVPVPPLLDETRVSIGLPAGEATTPTAPTIDDTSRYAVAIIDAGFDTSHPFIKDSIIREACFSAAKWKDNAVQKLCNHGTEVAGIVSGYNGSIPNHTLSGIAPETPLILINAYTEFDDASVCRDNGVRAQLHRR